MSRKVSNLLDYGIEEEVDPKAKFNSLISVTVSTIMCLAAKCPLPKSNIDTTKLFLSTITDDNGKTPRNIKGFLSLLTEYSGPYEANTFKEKRFEKPPLEKLMRETERKASLECVAVSKASPTHSVPTGVSTEAQALVKRNTKISVKKSEKEAGKKGKNMVSRIATSKSIISSKT